jgi:hypothetical protein
MAQFDWDSDEPWDEDQWEAFLRENDKRMDRYMELLRDFLRRHPRPTGEDPRRLARWKEALRAFIDEKGWTRDDLALPFLWLDEEGDFTEDDAWFDLDEALESAFVADPYLTDDEWEAASLDELEQLPIYQQAFALTRRVMDWSDDVPGGVKDSTLVQFCANVMQVPAKVAEGHAIGYERDMLGGNIACVKRALAAANSALQRLYQLKHEPYMARDTYRALYEDTYELRNALGLYVQDLRDRFNLGID